MSDNQPSGTLGGLLTSLLRGKTNDDGTPGQGFTATHKVLSGALGLPAHPRQPAPSFRNGSEEHDL